MRLAVSPDELGWASTRNGTGSPEPPSNDTLATWKVSMVPEESICIVTGETVTDPEALTLILLSSEDHT